MLHFDINKTGVDPALWNLQSTTKVKVAQLWPTFFDPMDCSPSISPGQDTGVGSPSLLQGIFPTQELNRGLLHCGWILYQPSYQGSSQSISSVQFSSVTQSCPILCDPMNLSTPGLPVYHQLPESTQTHVH